MKAIRIPRTFIEDHASRYCPTPEILRVTKRHAFIPFCPGTEGWDDLLSDAKHYCDGYPDMLGLMMSARATYKAMRNAMTTP